MSARRRQRTTQTPSPDASKLDIVTLTDSYGAFGFHRGTTQSTISYAPSNALIGGLASISFANAPEGMTTGPGQLQDGRPVDGRKGYTSTSGKGQLVDALARIGVDPAAVNLHEYGCGGTTALTGVETTGAFTAGMPTTRSTLGGTYGCPTGSLGANGWKATDQRSPWLQKQAWLAGKPNHPWKDHTLCDMIAHPPTGRCVVAITIAGNDLFDMSKQVPLVDPITGAFDPTGNLATRADQVASLSGGGAVQQIAAAVYLLNPDAEIWWVSYVNMPWDDTRVANTRCGTVAGTDPASAGPGWSPTGWNTYEDDGGKGSHPGAEFSAPNSNPYTMQTCTYPAGANGITFPAVWNLSASAGFFRAYGAYGPFVAQRDATYTSGVLRDWWAHFIADENAMQLVGSAASPGPFTAPTFFLTFVVTPGSVNWRRRNTDGASDYAIASSIRGAQSFLGRGWDQLYGTTQGLLANSGQIDNVIVLSGATFMTAHQKLTVASKDVTTRNVGRLFKDQLKPRMDAAENYWQSQGRKFVALHVWDTPGETHPAGNSQDDIDNYPALPQADFVDGVHPSSSGNPKWCNAVAAAAAQRSTLLREILP